MQSDEIRSRFLKFFENRGHKIIPSASLVPENDPSVLFNTAGMQPLVPYLLGQKHPMGARLADSQKCVRTVDIDEVGDNTHLTFFEMLGNWSLGDYWKKESINWSFELLTSKTEGFGLDAQRLYVTCFEGDENAPRDLESAEIWGEIFKKNNITGERIYFLPKEKNWWSAGDNGPCGPDTEMFYDLTGKLNKGMTLDEYLKADDEQKIVEIWNNVFMEYLSENGKVTGKLQTQNVDTGSGLERLVAVIQGKSNVFETDLFNEAMDFVKSKSVNYDLRSARIICDHLRTAVFMITDGVVPSNTGRGYILRRLLRRVFTKASIDELPNDFWIELIPVFIKIYKKNYPEIEEKYDNIVLVVKEETRLFKKPLNGIEIYRSDLEAAKLGVIKKRKDGTIPILKDKDTVSGLFIYRGFETYGNPIDLSINVAKELGFKVDEDEINKALKEHQTLSRTASAGMFKGGLADGGEETKKLHTATHLLRQALEDVLGEKIVQKGSNITAERLRFDFAFFRKMTDEEKKKVEEIVNEKIKLELPVQKVVMKKEDAEKTGAAHIFGDKYGDEVNVYYIGETLENAYSKEFCGGPHVKNTGELGIFKIQKEEAVAQGIRRIKATLS
jgi:alanyl-tRNA synthetase